MTEIKQNCLVIMERDIGDNDKLLIVLSERYGKLPVIAKGVKSVKNRHMACCQLFSYASFGLRKKGNYYYITDSDLIENYFDIRNDIIKLSLASYVCDVISDVTQEGNNDDEILRLALNVLYAIMKEIKPLEVIRATFEIRIASELGFMPDVDVCSVCSEKSADIFYFDIIEGNIVCEKCNRNGNVSKIDDPFFEKGLNKPISVVSNAVLSAIRYIIYSKTERILSFNLTEEEQAAFFDVAEKYLLNHLERSFYSLDFYKSLLKAN